MVPKSSFLISSIDLLNISNLQVSYVYFSFPNSQAVVLFAMGGYGTYLGFRIRYSDDMVSNSLQRMLIS